MCLRSAGISRTRNRIIGRGRLRRSLWRFSRRTRSRMTNDTSGSRLFSFAPTGLLNFFVQLTHGLRRGLYSLRGFAAEEVNQLLEDSVALPHRVVHFKLTGVLRGESHPVAVAFLPAAECCGCLI